MSERPFTPPGDDDLDAALRARRRLLPRFDAHADEQPSPELDRLVLSRAREALRREAPREKHYRSPRWAAPVAIAATVLLSLGLVLQMDPSRNDAVLDTAGDATATTAMSAAEPAEAARSSAPAAPVAPPPPPAAPAAAAVPAAPTLPAPAPPSAPPSASTSRSAPAPAPLAAPSFVADAPAGGAAPERALRDDARASLRKQATPVDAAAGATADGASAGIAEAATASSRSAEAARAAIPRDDPQRWLAAIEQLRVAGELDAARRELAAFRSRHPDLTLPESLDALR